VSEPTRATPEFAADLRVAAVLGSALSVIGAALGLLWGYWSPPGPGAEVLGHGAFIPDETESFVATDGRYLLIVTVVGLLAALVAWWVTPRRGPVVLLGMIVGGIIGSLLMELVGHLSGGGNFSGKLYQLSDGSTERFTTHLPVSLHAHGLLFVESAVAALVYGLLVAFATHDDLGRPDPVRAELVPAAVGVEASEMQPQFDGSVGAGDQPEYGGRYGDAPGALQQRDLPPQQPPQPY
jgi:uncharacterized membrane protein YeaQ/YmgE (transglycosylase-associated protein family)